MSLPGFLRNVTKLYSCSRTAKSSSFLCAKYHNGYQHMQERMPYQATQRNAIYLSKVVDGRSSLIGLVNAKAFSTSPHRLASHDHTKLWSAERALSVALLGVVPVALMYPSQAMDCILATTLVMHNHWGIEANVVDYVRPIIFGPVIPKIAVMAVYGVSIITLAGLLYFIFNDVGIANGIRLLWKL